MLTVEAAKGAELEVDMRKRDAVDPLAPFRHRFRDHGIIYLDGNSLGAAPLETSRLLSEVVEQQWGRDLISAWNKHDWIGLPQRIGAKLARLLGARPSEVVAADSTSINIFKVAAAALGLRPDRHVLLAEKGSFPTDLYVLEGLIGLKGPPFRLELISDAEALLRGEVALNNVAAVLLNHVNYSTGRMLDLTGVTAAVQARGALMIWDLAHSAGAVPVDLNAANVDFAVGDLLMQIKSEPSQSSSIRAGCGYKFLNGGPGAPAFLFVAERHQAAAVNPLSGWFGHKAAFAFEQQYEPADGISRFQCGTPSILALSSLEVGIDILLEADQVQLWQKARALGSLFLKLLKQECQEWGFRLRSPAEADRRGSQINFCHEHGYAIVQALIRRGVVGDFRAPDIIRLGFAPLYTSYKDVWDAVQHLKGVMQGDEWDDPEFSVRNAVT